MAKTTGDTCTFCGRSSRDVNLLINGISGCICDDCARQAYEIVKEQTGGKKTSFGLKQKDLPKPEDIKTFLDQYVIGQNDAKRYLSVSYMRATAFTTRCSLSPATYLRFVRVWPPLWRLSYWWREPRENVSA